MRSADFLFVVAAIGLAACDCEGDPEVLGDAGPITGRDAAMNDAGLADDDRGIVDAELDAGLSDSGIFDSGIFDSGISDSGIFDGGAPDTGEAACGRIEVNPPGSLFVGNSPSSAPIQISNVGCELHLDNVLITGPQGDVTHPSADDFSILCPCPTTLCDPRDPLCENASIELVVHYQNNDFSAMDLAELHIFSDDPTNPELIFILEGNDPNVCLPPTPQMTVLTLMPRAGMPVYLDGSQSSPGPANATIIDYEWSFLFTPGAAPVFDPPNTAQTSFTPPEAGIYVVGLAVENSCGARNLSPASETISVGP